MSPAQIEAQLKLIKDQMPETYKAITDKAGLIGRSAYNYVRRGVAGQPNKFYAMERGHVVGTPFDLPGLSAEMAQYVCQFGAKHWVMWALEAQQMQTPAGEAEHGQG
jgi:hypothetical protein